jgi:hypothetical protein
MRRLVERQGYALLAGHLRLVVDAARRRRGDVSPTSLFQRLAAPPGTVRSTQ